ncbi:MAG: tetratricopeptide repeat protein [Bdellovibrionales bacterium]
MLQFGACPRCQTQIPENRVGQNPIVCVACGFVGNNHDKKMDRHLEKRFVKVAFFTAIALVLGFLQTASWDKFALEIIPLKIKQYGGMASNENLIRIAQICAERLKHDCVETAYATLANRGQNDFFAELGKYQVRRGNKTAALQSLTQYFKQNGTDLEAAYQYAKVLGDAGKVEESITYFDSIIKAKPETLQITVVQNYVKMLVHNNRRPEALKLIKDTRKSSSSASMFMEDEYKQLEQQIAAK